MSNINNVKVSNYTAAESMRNNATTPYSPQLVISLPHSNITFQELADQWNKRIGAERNYDTHNGIVSCNRKATSIPPQTFSKLKPEVKKLIAKMPNSEFARDVLASV